MGVYMNARDRAAMLDIDGECTMCAAGEWPRDAITCPVCDADVPDEPEDDESAATPKDDGAL